MARAFVRATPAYLRRASAVLTGAPLTIAAWVNPASLPAAIMDVVSLSDDTVGQNAFELNITAANKVGARTIAAGANATSATTGAVSTSTWAHAAAVFASATSRTAYLNGVAATADTTNLAPTGIVATSIAAFGAGAFSLSFDGSVAEVAIWNVALDAAEMTALAAGVSPLMVRPTALVAYWPLIGNYSPEIDPVGRNELTVTSATAAAHCKVLYPAIPQWRTGARQAAALAADVTFSFAATAALQTTARFAADLTLAFSSTAALRALSHLAADATLTFSATANCRAGTDVTLLVNGVERTFNYDRESLELLDDLNELPNTASFECFGFLPLNYQVVRISYGAQKDFEGRILSVEEYHDRLSSRTLYRVSCMDYTWDADALLVTKAYGSQSATTTGQDLATNYLPTFTQGSIAASLPNVPAIQFKMTPASSAYRQLCDAFGGDTYVDYDKVVHLFTTETDVVPDTINASNTKWRRFKYRQMIARVANRIFVEGMGSSTASAAAVGSTSLPVADASPFSASGGSLMHGNQILTYSGISTGSTTAQGDSSTVTGSSSTVAARPRPTVTPTLGLAASGGAVQELGNWTAKFTHIYSDGTETPPSAASNAVAGTNFQSFTLTEEVGPSGVTDHGVYFKLPSYSDYGSQFGTRVTTGANGNGPTTHGNNTYQTTPHPPTTDPDYSAGGTFLYVNDTSVFASGGGSVKIGSQTITYTGRSTSSGIGALTGIPASGAGSIATTITIGTTVSVAYAAGSTSLPVADTSKFLSGGGSLSVSGQTITFTGRSTSSGAGNLTGIPTSGAGSLSATVTAGATITMIYPAGSTSLPVNDTSNFSSGGGTARVGSQTFTYTGRSTTSGAGNLTGIPASGSGSLSSVVSGGDTVLAGAGGNGTLTGIPSSGAGSIVNAINQGDEIKLLVQRDDTTSQSTYGIRHGYAQDRRLSTAGAQARGDAELTLRKDPVLEGSLVTDDIKVRSGRQITVSMASEWGISGTFTITKVRIFWEHDKRRAQREVTFSNHASEKDLFRLLRRIQEQQQQQNAA